MKSSNMKTVRKTEVIIFLIYLFLYFGMLSYQIIIENENWYFSSDILTNIGNLMSIIFIIIGIKTNITQNKITWYMFLIGLIFNFLGDFFYTVFESIFFIDTSSSGIYDLFYVLGSLCFLLALIFFIKNKRIGMIFIGFDSMITMVVSATFILKFVLLPIWADESLSNMGMFLSSFYPIVDLGYITALSSLLYMSKRHKLNISRIMLMLSYIIFFLADILYSMIGEMNINMIIYMDILWPSAAIILALSSIFSQPSEDIKTVNSYDETHRIKDLLYFLVPYFFIGVLVIFVSYKYLLKDPLVTGTLLAIILVIIRQIFFLYENKRLLKELKIANIKLAEKQIESEEEAKTDFLTGIYNRRYIDEIIKSDIFIDTEKHVMNIAILVIDIDYFKQINDSFGHAIGDEVLKEIAYDIKGILREEDKLGRFGGDEFIVFMPEKNKEILIKIAERINRKIASKNYAENRLKVTLSIGGAIFSGNPDEFNMEVLFNNADKMLYEVKESGRNNFRIF